jgi:hypothetical protein
LYVVAIVDVVSVVLVVYVDSACMLVAVVVTQTNGNLFNILLTDASQCSKDKLTVADNSASNHTCGASSAGSPTTYRDGNVSFLFSTDGSGSGSGFILCYKLSSRYNQ